MGFWSSVGNFFKSAAEKVAPFIPFAAPIASVASALIGKKSAEDTNQAQVGLFESQRSWEERMANTAHQRARADLEAAGLNPLLALNQGAATPHISPPQLINPGSMVAEAGSSAVQSAVATRTMNENIKLNRSQQAMNSAQTASIMEEAKRKALMNESLEFKTALDRYKFKRRMEAQDFEGLKDDVNEAMEMFNPFKSLFGSQRFGD